MEKVWGEPVDIAVLDGGVERRTYMIQSPYTDLKYRYFLIKDGIVVASRISRKADFNVDSQSTGLPGNRDQ